MIRQAYILPYRERRRLHDRAYRAQQRDHSEICGVLVVGNDKRIELWFLKNIAEKPYKYKIDLNDLRAVRNQATLQKKIILGSFHSHPVSEAIPGLGDMKAGFYRGIEMIYDVCAREAKLWRIRRSGSKRTVNELSLILESRPAGR